MKMENVKEAAMALDMAENEARESLAPRGEFSIDSTNRLIASLNSMLDLFKGGLPKLEEITEQTGELDIPVVKVLQMYNRAVEDAKMQEYSVDMDAIKTDRDLMMARGRIEAALKDRSFKAFLASQAPGEEPQMQVEVEIEKVQDDVPEGMHRMPDGTLMEGETHGAEQSDEDVDKLMMSRMY